MGTRYDQLSLEERYAIARLHEAGQSIRKIAAALGRAASTISREMKRNTGTGAKAFYRPVYADDLSWSRRWTGSRLERHDDLREGVLECLRAGWSPEQISGRLARMHGRTIISHESIYRFIYAQIRRHNDFRWRLYLPRGKFRRGWRGRRGATAASHIKHRTPLSARPEAAADRQQAGHWEADLMMFGNKKDNILVAQERHSRFIRLARQSDKRAERVARQLQCWFAPLPPPLRQTLTQDNGTEFAKHYVLSQKLGMKTFFCDPRSPWQKGGVENANGRLRRFITRKTKAEDVSSEDIQRLACLYNHTPRKCLDFQTPNEVFSKQLLHFKCESTYRPAPV